MKTFEAKSLLSASLDQLAVDQLRREEGEENGMRMRQIATDTHLPEPFVRGHVHEQATAPVHRDLVASLHAHSDAYQGQDVADAHAGTLADLERQSAALSATESMRNSVRSAHSHSLGSLFGSALEPSLESAASNASSATTQRNHAGGSSMRVVGTARGDPDDPQRIMAHPSGSDRPGALPERPRVPHLPMQDVGNPGAAIDPPAAPVVDTREIEPRLSDEQARNEMIALYDESVARGEVQLLSLIHISEPTRPY